MKFGGLSLTLGAAGALALMIVGASLSTTAGSNADADADGVIDLVDNCLGSANPVNQQGWQDDSDYDGFGDKCDGDYNNTCKADAIDFQIFGSAYLSTPGDNNWNEAVDMNQSGQVNAIDFQLFATAYGAQDAGPSGLKCSSCVNPIDGPPTGSQTGNQRCWFLPTHRVRCTHQLSGKAEGANDAGILTNPTSGRDLRFINTQHYSERHASLGAHCVYP